MAALVLQKQRQVFDDVQHTLHRDQRSFRGIVRGSQRQARTQCFGGRILRHD